jgi:Rrf2 family protein
MLSNTAESALRAVLYLARHAQEHAVRVDEMAEALAVPRNYLSKTLHILAKRGVLASTRGPRGGFMLGVPASELTLNAIVEPFDPIEARKTCLLGRKKCSDRDPCTVHWRWRSIADQIANFFQQTTVGDLIADQGREDAAMAALGSR